MPYINATNGFLKRHMSSWTFAFCASLVMTVLGLGSLIATNAIALPGTRTIAFFSPHTKQSVTVTYKRYGQYVPSAMRKLNYILRDWRTNQVVRMDPKLIDLLWEIHTDLRSRKPIHILSGYRSPKTNAKLRRRSRGVGRFSRHMYGMALDVRFPDVSLKRLRNSAMLKQRGGVGFYRGSFVHVDVGSVRHWPRMSKRQLAKLFRNTRSLHVPRGVARPARSKVAARRLPRPVVVSSAPSGVFRGAAPNRIKIPARTQIAAQKPVLKKPVKPKRRAPIRLAANVPLPRAKPAPVIVATAPVFNGSVPLPRSNPVVLTRLAALNAPKPPAAPKTPEVIIASASFVSFQRTNAPQKQKEVAIARPVASSVEVITARPVEPIKPKRGLFGLASLAPRTKTDFNSAPNRLAALVKTNQRPLAFGLMNVNRSLKGDRLISQAALEKIGSSIQLVGKLDAPDVTASIQKNPFKPENVSEKKSSPFGLLSALFPIFSDDPPPLRRR